MVFWVIAIMAVPGTWFGIPILYRRWASRDLQRRIRERRAIVLTYDDGPGDVVTSPLAELLGRRHARATFFLIGRNAAQRPEIVQRLHDGGHEIANHSFHHLNAWKTWPLRAVQDIRKGRETLERLIPGTLVFRPPFGKATLATLLYTKANGTRQAFWTHDSRDSWNRLPPEQILEQLRVSSGGVVLMHDFDAPRRGPSPEKHPDYVLTLTETIIDFAEANGFELLTFSELFEDPGRPESWKSA